ncbi:hypothetical protein Plhal304r1_c017g0062731 [Plasmopara halstedii]
MRLVGHESQHFVGLSWRLDKSDSSFRLTHKHLDVIYRRYIDGSQIEFGTSPG